MKHSIVFVYYKSRACHMKYIYPSNSFIEFIFKTSYCAPVTCRWFRRWICWWRRWTRGRWDHRGRSHRQAREGKWQIALWPANPSVSATPLSLFSLLFICVSIRRTRNNMLPIGVSINSSVYPGVRHPTRISQLPRGDGCWYRRMAARRTSFPLCLSLKHNVE